MRGDLQDPVVEGSLETGKTTRKVTAVVGCDEIGRENEPCPQREEGKMRSPRSGGGDVAGDEQDDGSGRWTVAGAGEAGGGE